MFIELSKSFSAVIKQYGAFFQKYTSAPHTVGSIVPSSRFLCQEMVSHVDFSKVNTVAELGAGDGVLTKFILSSMSAETTLDAYEIDEGFLEQLSTVEDHRLRILPCSAEHLIKKYDVIFSCLPLLSFPDELRLSILDKAQQNLNEGGIFIQFQYTRFLEKYLSQHFIWRRTFVLKNIPPAFVYICHKPL